ncbi:unnamed protein product [Phytomonas sp. Hart1]|nr:unnamed protein product [Phytomonas sp. Hart1]|eukprot:CCW66046.1 unnamed protein product [Phytomonas sp. isolate Hart1]
MVFYPTTVILFVVSLLLVLYFVVGIIVRYRCGLRHFPEVLPNYIFWCRLFSNLLRIITCGRCRVRIPVRNNALSGLTMLPSRPSLAVDVTFEGLSSDDNENWHDVNRAMEPAEVVVRNKK